MLSWVPAPAWSTGRAPSSRGRVTVDGRVAVGRTGPLLLGEAGAGGRVVGGGGARPHDSNKTPAALTVALEAGLGRIVVDNFHDLDLLDSLTRESRRRADVLLRLTPGIEPHTHKAIVTGGVDSKFGLGIVDRSPREGVRRAMEIPGLRLRGIHCHIGSQVMELRPF